MTAEDGDPGKLADRDDEAPVAPVVSNGADGPAAAAPAQGGAVAPTADPGRRRFLKLATCALGGGIGATVAVPAVRYLLHPVGRRTVAGGAEPIEVAALDQLARGGPPVKVRVVAASQRDAWATTRDVPLGAAWLQRTGDAEVRALSSACPHLGCAVAFRPDRDRFECPCHDSAFAVDGARMFGPAERGLDSLDCEVVDGRVMLRWVQFRPGGPDKVPA